MNDLAELKVLIRGAGGMGSGIAVRLMRSGIANICLLEQARPMAVERLAAFSDAVYQGVAMVEGYTAALISHPRELPDIWNAGCFGLLVDPAGMSLRSLRPEVCIDATGHGQGVFRLTDAPLVIGLGSLHQPGKQAHLIVGTSGQNLGRVLYPADAVQAADSDEPDGTLWNVRAEGAGMFRTTRDIGEYVQQGEVIGLLHAPGQHASRKSPLLDEGAREIRCPASGVLRGILRDYTPVEDGSRLACVDSGEGVSCHQVSRRALAVGGGVLEAILGSLRRRPQPHAGILCTG